MNARMLIAAALLLFTAFAWAEEGQAEFLREFVAGHYRLIGAAPEGGAAYAGTVEIESGDGGLAVTREIDGRKVAATGAIETATADAVPVLRVRFTDGGAAFEATYLIGSDLDNNARLSGYLYRADAKTAVPGLEALFAAPR